MRPQANRSTSRFDSTNPTLALAAMMMAKNVLERCGASEQDLKFWKNCLKNRVFTFTQLRDEVAKLLA